jgi:hypothetical protein
MKAKKTTTRRTTAKRRSVKASKSKLHKSLRRISPRGFSRPTKWFLSISSSMIAITLGLYVNLNNLMPLTGAVSYSVVTSQAENMVWSPSSAASIYNDSAASNGKAVKVSAAATGSSTVSVLQTQSLTVTAKGGQCGGAPKMTVKLDGVALGTKDVTATAWTQYNFPVTTAAGSHKIEVSFTNPYKQYSWWWVSCTRTLNVDKADTSAVETTPSPSPSPSPTAIVPAGVPGTWTLKWNDEFNVTSLDQNKWSNCWLAPNCGTMNNVTTDPANVAVANGQLVLTLKSSTSGALVISNKAGGFTFTQGVIEARIWFPGNGTQCYNWPAWWTNSYPNWPAAGEHDVAEPAGFMGSGAGNGAMTINYHSSTTNMGYTVPGYWCGGFHVYTLNKKATSADVYYDGKLVKSYPTNDNGGSHALALNIGSGGIPAYGTASQMKVDYVRAW